MIPESKEAAVRQAYDKGYSYELKYHGWSQCLILALQDVLDMRDDNIFKAASGLAGGIGDMGSTCGALIGASLMLGLKYGRTRQEIGQKKKFISSFVPVAKLYKWFEKEFGSTKCRDIRTTFGGGIHYDFGIRKQAKLAEKVGVFKKCSDLAGKTAAMTVELMWEAIEAEKKKITDELVR